MGKSDFYFDYDINVENWSEKVQNELETRLLDLASENTDLIGAAVAANYPAEATTPFLNEVRIIVYGRPDDTVGIETADTIEGAVKGAVDAVVRQVRKKRTKLRESWKRSAINNTVDVDAYPTDSDIPDENKRKG